YPSDDIHPGCDLTKVRVLLVEKRRILLDDKELRIVVERRVLPARDADRTELEREVVVLAGHAVASGAGAFRIAALDDPVLDAVEREVVVEAAVRFSSEALDGLRSLVGPQCERERSALRELDGRLCRLGAGWCGR